MKALLFVAFLAGSSIATLADNNLLKNGDFASGSARWEGDGHIADSGGGNRGAPAPATKGIVVKLRHLDWTKVTQDFDGRWGKYTATITYSVSPDFKLSTKAEDYINLAQKLNLYLKAFDGTPGQWVFIINDPAGKRFHPVKIAPKIAPSGIQTITATVNVAAPPIKPGAEPVTGNGQGTKGFYLAFPPGEGTITLQSISLDVQ